MKLKYRQRDHVEFKSNVLEAIADLEVELQDLDEREK